MTERTQTPHRRADEPVSAKMQLATSTGLRGSIRIGEEAGADEKFTIVRRRTNCARGRPRSFNSLNSTHFTKLAACLNSSADAACQPKHPQQVIELATSLSRLAAVLLKCCGSIRVPRSDQCALLSRSRRSERCRVSRGADRVRVCCAATAATFVSNVLQDPLAPQATLGQKPYVRTNG